MNYELFHTFASFFNTTTMYKPIFNKRNVLVFKQFSNKGYSLFACLGKEVIISVLSVATLENATASSLSVETDKITTDTTLTGRGLMLEEVSVVGTRAPLAESQQARMVTVLRRDDIQAAAVQSVNDLLKMAVGVDVRQRGPLGAQTDVSIRGSNYEQIAILLNGINICDPQTGHNAFDFPVDISDIERIEVLEGPAGRAYGTSSLLGAVNIVTASPPAPLQLERGVESEDSSTSSKLGVQARVEGGSYGYFNAGARATLHTPHSTGGEAFHSISGSYTRSDGYSRNKAGALNADYSGGKAFYEGIYDDETVRVRWHAGMSAKSWGSNTFYGAKWDDQYEHTLKTYTAVQAETKTGRVHLRPAVYWNRTEDRFELFRDAPDTYPFNYHLTNVYGVNLNSHFDWLLGRTALGVEVRNEDLVSGNLGEPLDHPKHIHGTDRDYEYGLNRTNINMVAEHNIILKRLTLSAGIVAVYNSWADMGVKVYPGIDISYRPHRHWTIFASYNSSLRMPSATELYYSVGGHKADKHLKSEETKALEGGVRYADNGVTGALSVFYNRHENLIDWIRHTADGDDAPWESVNFGRINSIGTEAKMSLNMLQLVPQQKVLQQLSIAYCYIHQDQKEYSDIQSRYALEYLRHKLTANARIALWKALTLNVSYRMQDRMGTYTDINGDVQQYKRYGIVDARLAWTLRSPLHAPHSTMELYLEANNLFDKTYVDYGNVPQPGVWVVAGFAIKI
jgi:iron complex outermembrane receptor protein